MKIEYLLDGNSNFQFTKSEEVRKKVNSKRTEFNRWDGTKLNRKKKLSNSDIP